MSVCLIIEMGIYKISYKCIAWSCVILFNSSLLLLVLTKAVVTCKPSYYFTVSGVLVLILGTQIDLLKGRFPEIVVRFFLFLETSTV